MLSAIGATGINSSGITILKASYGIQNTFQDVSTEIKNLVQDGELNFNVSPQSIGILDPAPGVTKNMQIQYTINGGKPNLLSKNDGEQVVLSAPPIKNKGNERSTAGHMGSIFGSVWQFIIMLFTTFFAMAAFNAGKYMLGSAALGWLFLAITAGTFGYFGLFFLPIILLIYFLIYPNSAIIPIPNS